jgi:creatinine amidohydrolase
MKWDYFENLNPKAFREIIEKYPIAYLPFGAYEWHGEALPFGTDTFRVRHVAAEVARIMGGIVLPSVWGTDIERQRQGKTLWGMETFALEPLDGNACMLSSSTFKKVVQEMLLSCRHMGFKLAVLLTGHAAVNQETILREAVLDAQKKKLISALYENFYSIYHPSPENDQHGGAAEVAEILVLNPKLVKLKRFASDPRDQKTGLAKSQMKEASVSFGKKLLKEQVDGIVKKMRDRK